MCRTIVGVSANLCAVDPDGKNIHSSVSCKFAETIKQVGGLPMVIPVGDPSFAKDYIETVDKLILSGGKMSILAFMEKRLPSRVMTTISSEISLSWPY